VTWFALALLGAVMQAGQFAVVKAWTRDVPPVVLIFWRSASGRAPGERGRRAAPARL